MEGYSVKVIECNKELSARERIAIKDVTNAIKLDEATQSENVVITPAYYAVLGVHNEKSDNVDYEVYIVIDNNGIKYVTGSKSFWNSFISIYEEMEGENEEYSIMCYRMDSKNYKGKQFLTCSII